MDILKLLNEQKSELYEDDLEMLEAELAIGGYSEEYIAECRNQINSLRKWMKGTKTSKETISQQNNPVKKGQSVIVSLSDVAPVDQGTTMAGLTKEEIVLKDIEGMRKSNNYKQDFMEYIKKTAFVDPVFIDKHFSFFSTIEMDEILSVKQMGEDFLEKYFDMLSHEKIARYQLFSESFFIKHFSEMNPNIVLRQGKNEWRKKEMRSKQLDVFLRLKGVSI